RLRLGVGPGNPRSTEELLGIPYERPLATLREYVAVLKAALGTGAVDFDGQFFRVHFRLGDPLGVPVLISALRPASFRLAVAATDGAIAWICPLPYLRD